MQNNNKKIYLVKLDEEAGEMIPPFGLLYVGGKLRSAGYDVKVIHAGQKAVTKQIDDVIKDEPLFIGFSVITGSPTAASVRISQMFKAKSNIKIVWGGVHPSLLPQQCLAEDYIDFVILQEGEETALALADQLSSGKQGFTEINGLGYKDNGRIMINNPRPLNRILKATRMDFDLIDLSKYVQESFIQLDGKRKKIRKLSYISSRGCPHNCGFCYNLKFNQRQWRYFPENIVYEDIQYLKEKYKVNAIHFWDDNFFVDKARALNILKHIGVFPEFELRIDYITEELAAEFKKLNTINLLIGAESGSDRILKLMNKGFSKTLMMDKARVLAKYNVPVLYSFMLGAPTEKKEELYQTIDLIAEISQIHKNSSFTVGMYMPYPGTELYQMAIKEGFTPPSRTENWQLIDRWRNTVPLPWIDRNIYKSIRYFSALLSDNNSLLRSWALFRLKKKILKFKLDIKIVALLRKINEFTDRK